VSSSDYDSTTFHPLVGTNHLGHFYLNHLLLPKVNKETGRIVVTASSVHDPESPGGKQGMAASLGDLKGFEVDGAMFQMVDGGTYNGDKAYKDSKLCNILFTRELQRRLESSDVTKNIVVNSFSPGLITSSGFFRYQSPLFSKVCCFRINEENTLSSSINSPFITNPPKFIQKAFGFIAEKVARVAETPEWGGGCLDYMVTNVDTRAEFWNSEPGSSKYGDAAYGKQFTVSNISNEAKDDAKAKKLWELSEVLVGIA
jgi:protochlorophyllide reductase